MSATLVLVNGAPGSGKSTVARAVAAQRPAALALDVDVIRTWLGGWAEQDATKRLARDLGWAMVRTHLAAGLDVVLAQLVLRAEVVDELASIAADSGAAFVEVLLTGDPVDLRARFLARRAELDASGEPHPQDELDPAAFDAVLEGLDAVVAHRPDTTLVETTTGEVAVAVTDVAALLPSA